MSIHRTGNSGSKPPIHPNRPATPSKDSKESAAINRDGFEGMVRPEQRASWRHADTGLHPSLEASSPSHEVLSTPDVEQFDDALDEFNLLLLQFLDH